MTKQTTTGRIHNGDVWSDAQIPRRLSDLVFALNRGGCPVAGVTEDSITLADGRVLCVRVGWLAGSEK